MTNYVHPEVPTSRLTQPSHAHTPLSSPPPPLCHLPTPRHISQAATHKSEPKADPLGLRSCFGQIYAQIHSKPLHRLFALPAKARAFNVRLVGEGAVDAGGPYREAFSVMGDELMSDALSLFVPSENNTQVCPCPALPCPSRPSPTFLCRCIL